MSLTLVFWILMLIWAVFGFAGDRLGAWAPWGNTILLFVLLLILGWGQFGAPVH
jgi:hypothetical protein